MNRTLTLRTIGGTVALSLGIALGGVASSEAATKAPRPSAKQILKSGPQGLARPARAAKAKKTRKPRKAPAAQRRAMRVKANSAAYRPATGYYGGSGWFQSGGHWLYVHYWNNPSSSAPPGAHLIGWATQNNWYYEVYYYGVDRRAHFWWAGNFVT